MSIFDGDGRRMVQPVNAPDGTHPKALRRGVARMIIESFAKRGESFHSNAGSTLWVLATHCKEQGIQYAITSERFGYLIRRGKS